MIWNEIQITVFLDMTLCNLVDIYQCFEGSIPLSSQQKRSLHNQHHENLKSHKIKFASIFKFSLHVSIKSRFLVSILRGEACARCLDSNIPL
jgi:hypothetical protein